jgi:hypothetical protein
VLKHSRISIAVCYPVRGRAYYDINPAEITPASHLQMIGTRVLEYILTEGQNIEKRSTRLNQIEMSGAYLPWGILGKDEYS